MANEPLTITDLFPAHDLINYAGSVGLNSYKLQALFPDRRFETDDIKVIQGQTNVPEIAHIHGEDTESEIGSRSGEISNVEPYILKRKMYIKGSEMRKLRFPRTPQEQDYLMNKVYNDATNLVNSLGATLELMRVKALTEQTFTIGSAQTGGAAQKFDYALPSTSQLDTVDFSKADVDPIEVLETWSDNADFNVTRALTSKKVLRAIRHNPNTVKRINGLNSQFSLNSIMPSELEKFLADNDLPEIVGYSQKYKEDGVVKNMISDGRIALFTDGLVGETAFGMTEEEAAFIGRNDVDTSKSGNIMLSSYHEGADPIVDAIKATALAVPTLAQKNTLLQANALG